MTKIWVLYLVVTEKSFSGDRVVTTLLKSFSSEDIAKRYVSDYSMFDSLNAKYIVEAVEYYG